MKKPVAVVTGSSRGIGAAAAKEFAARDYRVVVNHRSSPMQAKQVYRDILEAGGEVEVCCADVATSEGAAALIAFARAKYGQIDVLVCNAGIAHFSLADQTTDQDWRGVMAQNLDSVFYCCRAAIPDMVRAKSGAIVTVSSVWGQCGASCESAYAAAKAGVIGYTKSLALELAPSNITANCVAPGVIDTGMNARFSQAELREIEQSIPLGRFGAPAEVAKLIADVAENRYITGQVIAINGGMRI